MFIRATSSCWHQQSILPKSEDLRFPFPDHRLVFHEAAFRLCGRSAPRGDRDHFKGKGKSLTNQLDPIAALDPRARRRTFAIDTYVTGNHRGGRLAPRFEESAEEHPSINA